MRSSTCQHRDLGFSVVSMWLRQLTLTPTVYVGRCLVLSEPFMRRSPLGGAYMCTAQLAWAALLQPALHTSTGSTTSNWQT